MTKHKLMLTLVFSICVCCSLTACGDKSEASSSNNTSSAVTTSSDIDFAKSDGNTTALLIITLGALCGLRRGEMAGLKWENVQLEGFTELHITQTVIETEGTTYIKPPKTASGIRTIPIGKGVVEILKEAKADYEKRKAMYGDKFVDSGYVLNHEKTGMNLMPEAINSRYRRFMEKQGRVPYKNSSYAETHLCFSACF